MMRPLRKTSSGGRRAHLPAKTECRGWPPASTAEGGDSASSGVTPEPAECEQGASGSSRHVGDEDAAGSDHALMRVPSRRLSSVQRLRRRCPRAFTVKGRSKSGRDGLDRDRVGAVVGSAFHRQFRRQELAGAVVELHAPEGARGTRRRRHPGRRAPRRRIPRRPASFEHWAPPKRGPDSSTLLRYSRRWRGRARRAGRSGLRRVPSRRTGLRRLPDRRNGAGHGGGGELMPLPVPPRPPGGSRRWSRAKASCSALQVRSRRPRPALPNVH